MVRIAHLADIHIQDRRRAEYAAVFTRLYESLRAEAPDLIVVAGDVFDNKMRASPNNMADVAIFLESLADIASVVLIGGNHEIDTSNPGSLDLLTPLVTNHRRLQPPRLTYWRDSGVYAAHGIVWTVIATDGERPSEAAERALLDAPDMETAPHICLFHEEVNGALFPNGALMRDFKLVTTSFARYDLALGGHIHLRQLFAPRAAYCGSLVQQNIGEKCRGHGYILWELAPSSEHEPLRSAPPRMRGVDIPNENGFVRLEIDALGRDVTPRPLPSAPIYWDVLHDARAAPPLVAALISEYTTQYGAPPRLVSARAPHRDQKEEPNAPNAPVEYPAPPTVEDGEQLALVAAQAAARELASHETIIRELMAGDPLVEPVLALHRARYREPDYQGHAGGRVRLLRVEFDNWWSYGRENCVNFESLEGCLSGVIALNSMGKSAFIEAVIFALYDKCDRAPTKASLIHWGATSCRVALEFELDGKRGRIEKLIMDSKVHGGELRYQFEYAGENRAQGGIKATVAEIAKVVGTIEPALASSFQVQDGQHSGFVALSPAERKKMLADVMELGSFDTISAALAKEITVAGRDADMLAAQFRGVSAADLDTQRDAEEERLATLGEDLVQASAAAAMAAAAATAAAQALGAANAQAAAAAATATAAAAVADSYGHVPADAAAELAHWTALVGELTPEESRRSDREPNVGHASVACGAYGAYGAGVTLDQLRTAAAAASVASERAALAITAAQDARVGLAAAPKPTANPDEVRAALAEAKRVLETPPPSADRPSEPVPISPGFEVCVVHERSGPRPTRDAVDQALLALRAPEEDGSLWNPVEYARWQELATKLAAAPPAPSDAEMAALRESVATAASAAAQRPQAASLGLAAALQEARAWAAAMAHLATIQARLVTQPGCPGCARTQELFDAGAAAEAAASVAAAEHEYQRALAAERHECERAAAAEVAATAALAAATKAAQQAATLATARRKIAELDVARGIASRQAARAEHQALVETANYWHAEAWRQFTRGEAERKQYSDTQARAGRTIATLELSLADIEAATARHHAAERAHASADAAAAAATASAQALATLAASLQAARGRLVAAMLWWRDAAQTATAAAECRARAAVAAAMASEATQAVAAATAESHAATARSQQAAASQAAVQRGVATAAGESERLAAALAFEQDRAAKHTVAAEHRAALRAYKAVLNPVNGIGHQLLERGRALFERRINDGLRELGAPFRIELTQSYEVIHRPLNNKLGGPISMNGGYQKFVLSLAVRLTIWRLSTSLRPDAHIIDEGFGACSADNLNAIVMALEALASMPDGPRLVFLVTHIDALNVRLERALEITTVDDCSHITNLTARELAERKLVIATHAPRAPRAAAPEALPPDPAIPGNVYCAVCKQSIRAGWTKTHLASAKHDKAATKARNADD